MKKHQGNSIALECRISLLGMEMCSVGQRYCFQSSTCDLFMEAFSPFPFKVIIGRYVLTVILLIGF